MANKVFVGPNQEIMCKYVTKGIGNVHSSSGSDLGAVSVSQSWNLVACCGRETSYVVCGQDSLGRGVGMSHLEHRKSKPRGVSAWGRSLKACPGA